MSSNLFTSAARFTSKTSRIRVTCLMLSELFVSVACDDSFLNLQYPSVTYLILSESSVSVTNLTFTEIFLSVTYLVFSESSLL